MPARFTKIKMPTETKEHYVELLLRAFQPTTGTDEHWMRELMAYFTTVDLEMILRDIRANKENTL